MNYKIGDVEQMLNTMSMYIQGYGQSSKTIASIKEEFSKYEIDDYYKGLINAVYHLFGCSNTNAVKWDITMQKLNEFYSIIPELTGKSDEKRDKIVGEAYRNDRIGQGVALFLKRVTFAKEATLFTKLLDLMQNPNKYNSLSSTEKALVQTADFKNFMSQSARMLNDSSNTYYLVGLEHDKKRGTPTAYKRRRIKINDVFSGDSIRWLDIGRNSIRVFKKPNGRITDKTVELDPTIFRSISYRWLDDIRDSLMQSGL